jgi:hypothetical protein
MAERQVESRLADLAGAVDWPPSPDVLAGVRAGIARRRRRRRLILLLAAALAALALLGGAAAAASFELRGAVVQKVPSLPPGAGAPLDLGVRYPTLAAAEAGAGFRALVPGALGRPDEAWYRSSPGVLTLVYHPRRGLPASGGTGVGALVMEAQASIGRTSFVKLAPGDASIQPVTVNGGQGFWISGPPHAFFFYGAPGGGRVDSFRLAGDVLIWNQGGLVIRVESALAEPAVLRIAGTVAGTAVYQRHEMVPRGRCDRGPGGRRLRWPAGPAAPAARARAAGRRPGTPAGRRRLAVPGARRPDGAGRPHAAGRHAVA